MSIVRDIGALIVVATPVATYVSWDQIRDSLDRSGVSQDEIRPVESDLIHKARVTGWTYLGNSKARASSWNFELAGYLENGKSDVPLKVWKPQTSTYVRVQPVTGTNASPEIAGVASDRAERDHCFVEVSRKENPKTNSIWLQGGVLKCKELTIRKSS